MKSLNVEDDIREKVLYNGRKIVPWIACVFRDKWEKGSGGNFGSNESSFHSHKCFLYLFLTVIIPE